jgi:hypothetical protein
MQSSVSYESLRLFALDPQYFVGGIDLRQFKNKKLHPNVLRCIHGKA